MLDSSKSIDDLEFLRPIDPNPLQGALKSRYSIRMNDQRRLCFLWKDGNAAKVPLLEDQQGKKWKHRTTSTQEKS